MWKKAKEGGYEVVILYGPGLSGKSAFLNKISEYFREEDIKELIVNIMGEGLKDILSEMRDLSLEEIRGVTLENVDVSESHKSDNTKIEIDKELLENIKKPGITKILENIESIESIEIGEPKELYNIMLKDVIKGYLSGDRTFLRLFDLPIKLEVKYKEKKRKKKKEEISFDIYFLEIGGQLEFRSEKIEELRKKVYTFLSKEPRIAGYLLFKAVPDLEDKNISNIKIEDILKKEREKIKKEYKSMKLPILGLILTHIDLIKENFPFYVSTYVSTIIGEIDREIEKGLGSDKNAEPNGKKPSSKESLKILITDKNRINAMKKCLEEILKEETPKSTPRAKENLEKYLEYWESENPLEKSCALVSLVLYPLYFVSSRVYEKEKNETIKKYLLKVINELAHYFYRVYSSSQSIHIEEELQKNLMNAIGKRDVKEIKSLLSNKMDEIIKEANSNLGILEINKYKHKQLYEQLNDDLQKIIDGYIRAIFGIKIDQQEQQIVSTTHTRDQQKRIEYKSLKESLKEFLKTVKPEILYVTFHILEKLPERNIKLYYEISRENILPWTIVYPICGIPSIFDNWKYLDDNIKKLTKISIARVLSLIIIWGIYNILENPPEQKEDFLEKFEKFLKEQEIKAQPLYKR